MILPALGIGLVAAEHFMHEIFLFGRTHGHENNVGALEGDVVQKRLFFFVVADEAVAEACDVYFRMNLTQMPDHTFNNLLPGTYEIETFAVAVKNGL